MSERVRHSRECYLVDRLYSSKINIEGLVFIKVLIDDSEQFVKKHGLPTTDIASMVSDAFDTRGVANGRVDPRYSEGGYGRSPSWEQPSQKWFKNTLQGCSYSTQEKLTIPMLKECRTRNAKDFLTPN